MSAAPTLKVTPPAQGAKITIANGKLSVPVNPIVPFIEGDGTGPDIWRASVRVMDAAVARAYGGQRRIQLGRPLVRIAEIVLNVGNQRNLRIMDLGDEGGRAC